MKKITKRLLGSIGYDIVRARSAPEEGVYHQDGLHSIHDHSFMEDPAFQHAYQRGLASLETPDFYWHWRVHIGLWVANCASKLPGDFVECGVNYGFMSSAIMQYLDWNRLDKSFYLLDTFQGFDERYLTEEETQAGALEKGKSLLESGQYTSRVDHVRQNFAEWKNTHIIVGTVPDTLDQVNTDKVAYLHLDMNCAPPEVAALSFFWDKLVTGAFVLMDDYAYNGYRPQKIALDTFASSKNVTIVSLPTGQGLLIKPPPALQ